MKSRLLVALVGIPLLLIIVLVCPKIVTAVAVAVLSAIGAWELLHSTGIVENTRMLIYSMIVAFLLPLWCYLGDPIAPGSAVVVLFGLALFIEALAAYPKIKFSAVSGCLFGAIVIPLCLSGLVRIIMRDGGRYLVLVPILIPFLADAGAYFAGRFLGKHHMAPLLSPHKTVEGAVGGVVVGILSMIVYGAVMQLVFGHPCNYLWAAVYGLAGSLVSIVGDLSFSMIKRETGIKDYGTIFRAHGGVLDRFDSVIFSIPVVELLMLLIPVLA